MSAYKQSVPIALFYVNALIKQLHFAGATFKLRTLLHSSSLHTNFHQEHFYNK